MTDASLRELERRWRESGSLDDEVAWLAARRRSGELGRAHLELAAACGHRAAGLACGTQAASPPETYRALARTLTGVGDRLILVAVRSIAASLEETSADAATRTAASLACRATEAALRPRSARAQDQGALVRAHAAWLDLRGLDIILAGPLSAWDLLRLALETAEREALSLDVVLRVLARHSLSPSSDMPDVAP
ncbi:MAG: hypothetical protein KF878_16475 [Planctomycetes bacterium]|nr:hypothetical protein [Planctomycetota bacterium]